MLLSQLSTPTPVAAKGTEGGQAGSAGARERNPRPNNTTKPHIYIIRYIYACISAHPPCRVQGVLEYIVILLSMYIFL